MILKYLLSAVPIGLVAYGVVSAINDDGSSIRRRSQIPFVVNETNRDLGEVESGESEVVFPFTNPDSQPRRILGCNEACGRNCCMKSKHRGQVTVQPGETYNYIFHLRVGPGEFGMTMTMYVEENGIRTVELPISGIGIPARSLDDAAQLRAP